MALRFREFGRVSYKSKCIHVAMVLNVAIGRRRAVRELMSAVRELMGAVRELMSAGYDQFRG